MKRFLLLSGVFFGVIFPASAQDNLSASSDTLIINLSDFDSDTSGISLLQFDTWKFNPGHDTSWAHPEYDDSNWHVLKPASDSILAVTDSLWRGHGWWRLTFRVDSSFYKVPRVIDFESNGAAEIFIDGKKIASYGIPSENIKEEILPRIIPFVYPDFPLKPAEKHILAIRYSFHQYDQVKKLTYGRDLDIGFQTLRINTSDRNIANYNALIKPTLPLLISIVVLFMIMLLHFIFFLKFPNDKSNLWIFLLTLHLLLLACVFVFVFVINLTGYAAIIIDYAFSYLYFQFCCMIPVALSSLLRTKQYKIWNYLAGSGLIIAGIHYLILNYLNEFFSAISVFIPIGIAIMVFVAAFFIIWDAIKLKRKNIWIISIGFLSIPATLLIVITIGIIVVFTSVSEEGWIDIFLISAIVFAFLLLPVSLSVYTGKMFFDLYGDLESKVSERTKELNKKNKKLEEANQQIQGQRDEVVKARDNLQKALDELQATQTQLVQQEKLASLGQLTAGIAHEIKNPLNFVNNFSDLSVELAEESKEELSAISDQLSDKDQERVNEALEILSDIEMNLKKIHEHGSRADSIVKSMLQHSRGGSGKMEPTDLNGLVKEYVNLSFHGMRAGKNPINVDMEFELDEKIGEIPLVAEDFSRVIVNVCNNAFDAMREKGSEKAKGKGEKYSPKLTVRTKSDGNAITLEIEDNGSGIPEEMKDKILQPFFTTKKGTEGTGLGLSITNDIIKAHGGQLDLHSQPGQTVFTIKLNES